MIRSSSASIDGRSGPFFLVRPLVHLFCASAVASGASPSITAGPDIGKRDGRIAAEAGGLGPQERRAGEAAAQLVVRHLEHRARPRIRCRRRERRLARHGRLAVPRARALAEVAAELPLAHPRPELGLDLAAMLDGEVRDAPAGVEHVGRHEGLGGAGVETGAARAAAIRQRRIALELGGGQQHADEEPRPEARPQQHRVLADPAEARPRREIALEHGARVDVSAAPRATRLFEIGAEPVEPGRDHVVIVAAPGVARHGRPRRIGGLALVVVQRDGHDGGRARQHSPRVEPLPEAPAQIAHAARMAGLDPALERRPVLGRLGGADGDRVEAERERPRLDRLGERRRREAHGFLAMTIRWLRVSVRPPSSR